MPVLYVWQSLFFCGVLCEAQHPSMPGCVGGFVVAVVVVVGLVLG